MDVCSWCHPANRKVIEQGQSRAVADKLANIDLKTSHFDSCQFALQAPPRHRSGLRIELTCKLEFARPIGSHGEIPSNRQIDWGLFRHLRMLIRLHFVLPPSAQ